MTLRRRLLVFGILLTAGPLAIVGAVTSLVQRDIAETARAGTSELATADLHHILDLVSATSEGYVRERERRAQQSLVFAREILARSGGARVPAIGAGRPAADATTVIDAQNQFTKETRQVRIRLLQLGAGPVSVNNDPARPQPVVDEVRDKVGAVATIFQRMNEGWDMLRVSTNVIDAKGRRAVGTYIPATNPDGAPNPVVSAIKRGETFVGRAFVVNAWYLGAYEPIRQGPEIIGMLFIGLPEREAFEGLLAQLTKFRIGRTGYISILTGKGDARGTYVLSRDRKRDGENLWQAADGVIREMVTKAVVLPPGGRAEHRFAWREGDDPAPRETVAALAYFAPWDWVICAAVPEDELMATASRIDQMGRRSTRLLAALSAVAIALSMAVWAAVSRRLGRDVSALVEELSAGAEQVAGAAGQVATSAQSLSQGATEQAASLEETSASMEEVAAATRQNAERASRAAALMHETARTVGQSHASLGEMVAAMRGISESSTKVAQIVKAIDGIAFQTNILALNAAVEAARAGAAGMGFAVVADEVRNLAQRSGQAARDTAALIEDARARAEEGNCTVDRVAASIGGIAESAGHAKTLVDEITASTAQQSQAIGQVAQALAQMEQVTQHTAAIAQESAAASEELNAQAEVSMTVVGRLAAMTDGPKQRPRRRPGRGPSAGRPPAPARRSGTKAA